MDIWKVSERAIFTIQCIVRVSPDPRFVSSVSRHCASPHALTLRSFQPKHDTGDAKEIAHQYNGKRDRQPIARQFGQVVNAYSCSRSPWSAATTGLPLPSRWGGTSRSAIDQPHAFCPTGHSGPAKSLHSSDLLGYTREGSVLVSEAVTCNGSLTDHIVRVSLDPDVL